MFNQRLRFSTEDTRHSRPETTRDIRRGRITISKISSKDSISAYSSSVTCPPPPALPALAIKAHVSEECGTPYSSHPPCSSSHFRHCHVLLSFQWLTTGQCLDFKRGAGGRDENLGILDQIIHMNRFEHNGTCCTAPLTPVVKEQAPASRQLSTLSTAFSYGAYPPTPASPKSC